MCKFVQSRRIVVRKLRKCLLRRQVDLIITQAVKGTVCLIVFDNRPASRKNRFRDLVNLLMRIAFFLGCVCFERVVGIERLAVLPIQAIPLCVTMVFAAQTVRCMIERNIFIRPVWLILGQFVAILVLCDVPALKACGRLCPLLGAIFP